jgi:hypothetical protein
MNVQKSEKPVIKNFDSFCLENTVIWVKVGSHGKNSPEYG